MIGLKYGCLYWKNTGNIGDDIQTYAQKRFLPRIDYLVDREYLNLFRSREHEKVACIMNGWYLHSEGTAWPPAADLVPLPVSMHFTPSLSFLNADKQDAGENVQVEYLKQYAPIGCRDTTTLELMKKNEVPAYFSGCMTLTIDPFEGIAPSGEVILIDVPENIQEYVKSKVPSAQVDTHEKLSLYYDSFESRMQQVEERLKRYQAAKLVITTRLHCCMPCLALGTPVLLLYEGRESERYEGLRQYAHVVTQEDILTGKRDEFLMNPQPNPTEFKETANRLKEIVRKFVAHPEEYVRNYVWDEYAFYCKQMELICKKEQEDEEKYENRLVQMQEAWGFVKKYEKDTKVLFDKIETANQQIQQLQQDNQALRKSNQTLEEQNAALEQNVQHLREEIEKIYRSRSWQFCRKIQSVRSRMKRKKNL